MYEYTPDDTFMYFKWIMQKSEIMNFALFRINLIFYCINKVSNAMSFNVTLISI